MFIPIISVLLVLILICDIRISYSHTNDPKCSSAGSNNDICTGDNDDTMNIGGCDAKINKAMLKEKSRRENNALEKSLEYFKLKNEKKLSHFNRRPQADTVSIRINFM